MNQLDIRDWLVMAAITHALAAGTVFLFLHPSDTNFATWCAFIATVGGIYHWIVTYDSKHCDAQEHQ